MQQPLMEEVVWVVCGAAALSSYEAFALANFL